MKKIILLFVLLLLGCNVNSSKINEESAKKLADLLTYTQDDRTGLCFAVIASRKTGDTDQSGLGITEVPCENVNRFIK